MDTLHTVLRSIRGETKSRRDHLSVFRQFLDHLDRAGKRSAKAKTRISKQPSRRKASKRSAKS